MQPPKQSKTDAADTILVQTNGPPRGVDNERTPVLARTNKQTLVLAPEAGANTSRPPKKQTKFQLFINENGRCNVSKTLLLIMRLVLY